MTADVSRWRLSVCRHNKFPIVLINSSPTVPSVTFVIQHRVSRRKVAVAAVRWWITAANPNYLVSYLLTIINKYLSARPGGRYDMRPSQIFPDHILTQFRISVHIHSHIRVFPNFSPDSWNLWESCSYSYLALIVQQIWSFYSIDF